MSFSLYGVDPGLVHTGVVKLEFYLITRQVTVGATVVNGPDAQKVADLTAGSLGTWIEGYKPRSHFNTDARMTKAVNDMKQACQNSHVLLNTGVKKVIRQPLMELFHLWRFSQVTHHQDLRSAARILLYGMLKDEAYNKLVSDIVRDYLDGNPWIIIS